MKDKIQLEKRAVKFWMSAHSGAYGPIIRN